jgi:hypothetical protein
MKRPEFTSNPRAKKFIIKVINTESGHKTLAGKSFADIVRYANRKGYDITDIDLLGTLTHYYRNEFPLPYWIASKLGDLATWGGWQKG